MNKWHRIVHLHVQVQWLLVAGLAATAAGCSPSAPSPSTATTAASATAAAAVTASASAGTCAQQYAAWKTGPALAAEKTLTADLDALQADGNADDIPRMSADLQQLGKDATTAQGYPMPSCADPAGYWAQILTLMRSAGDNAGSATGLGGLLLAEAPLKQVPAVQAKLSAELARTAGVKPS